MDGVPLSDPRQPGAGALTSRVQAISVGLPQALRSRGGALPGGGLPSGFVKTPVTGPLWLGPTGLTGDGQADQKHHGGPDKAVCVYPAEHYPHWQARLGGDLGHAAFGENFTTLGLSEAGVCIGDTFRVGSAVVQVSQPRQPCHKLAARHDQARLTLWVQESGLTGWYFRVLEPGEVQAGLPLDHLSRPEEPVTLAEANRVMHRDRQDLPAIRRLLAQPALSRSWRATLEQRLAGRLEDSAPRLLGTAENP